MLFKKITASIFFVLTICSISVTSRAGDGDLLTGDTRLSCEALVCLSSGENPSECKPSLDRYFGLRPDDRPNFLSLCPKK